MKLEGIEGRVAVVTGSAQGIGRAICTALASQGAIVVGCDLQESYIDGVVALTADVTDPLEVDDAISEVERTHGAPSILVLNAGIFIVEPFEESSLEHWRQTLDVNLTGSFICARRTLPAMRAASYGRVVAIGSSAGVSGGANSCAAYAASKAGVMCLAKSIANEYAATGVTSNALAPALIDTAMMAEQPPGIEQRVPVGRLGRPEEVAELVAYLCSAHAGFITGEVIDINGGFFVD